MLSNFMLYGKSVERALDYSKLLLLYLSCNYGIVFYLVTLITTGIPVLNQFCRLYFHGITTCTLPNLLLRDLISVSTS